MNVEPGRQSVEAASPFFYRSWLAPHGDGQFFFCARTAIALTGRKISPAAMRNARGAAGACCAFPALTALRRKRCPARRGNRRSCDDGSAAAICCKRRRASKTTSPSCAQTGIVLSVRRGCRDKPVSVRTAAPRFLVPMLNEMERVEEVDLTDLPARTIYRSQSVDDVCTTGWRRTPAVQIATQTMAGARARRRHRNSIWKAA